MEHYNNKGMSCGYKNREILDYYATPSSEVINILEVLGLDLNGSSILEPCVGGGHMLKGILDYCDKESMIPFVYISDIITREGIEEYLPRVKVYKFEEEGDFLSNEYSINSVDYIIMNPPYSLVKPFTVKALDIVNKGLLTLVRLQFLEGKGRYEHIFKDNPPNDIYVYVDRINLCKNGDFSKCIASSPQAYAWVCWNKQSQDKQTKLHWIRRK